MGHIPLSCTPSSTTMAVSLRYSTGALQGPVCFSRAGWSCAFRCGYLPLPHALQYPGQGLALVWGRDTALPHADSCARQLGRRWARLEVHGSYTSAGGINSQQKPHVLSAELSSQPTGNIQTGEHGLLLIHHCLGSLWGLI